MSTRGTAYFEIRETKSDAPVRVGRLGIPRDGYPSGFGLFICGIIDDVYISETVGKIDKFCFRNVERAILHITYGFPTSPYDEDEYLYRFIFTLQNQNGKCYPISDVLEIEIKHKYGSNNFKGTFEEFKVLCGYSDETKNEGLYWLST